MGFNIDSGVASRKKATGMSRIVRSKERGRNGSKQSHKEQSHLRGE